MRTRHDLLLSRSRSFRELWPASVSVSICGGHLERDKFNGSEPRNLIWSIIDLAQEALLQQFFNVINKIAYNLKFIAHGSRCHVSRIFFLSVSNGIAPIYDLINFLSPFETVKPFLESRYRNAVEVAQNFLYCIALHVFRSWPCTPDVFAYTRTGIGYACSKNISLMACSMKPEIKRRCISPSAHEPQARSQLLLRWLAAFMTGSAMRCQYRVLSAIRRTIY